jgi:hypothetical protein
VKRVRSSSAGRQFIPFGKLRAIQLAPIDRLRNPLQPQDIASRDDPEVQRDSLCGLDDTDQLRSTPQRKAIT